jgi:TonB family protein
MKSVRRRFLSSVCAFALAANGVVGVTAQDRKSEGKAGNVLIGAALVDTVRVTASDPASGVIRAPEVMSGGFGNGAGQVGDGAFQFFSQEMSFDSRMVKGAPFSADIVSETIQTLPDGNRIVQRSEGHVYRDGQGRTRNERTYQMGGSSEQRQTISIFDPVAGANYVLDPETRTARKTNSFINVAPPPPPPPPPIQASPSAPASVELPKRITVSGGVLQGSAIKRVQPPYPPLAKAAKASGAVQVQILVSETGEVMEANVISGHPLLRDAAVQAASQWQFKPTELSGRAVKVQGILTFNFTLVEEPSPTLAPSARSVQRYNTNKEELGKQVIEGVECEGTRAITTIPAGAVGNERPIEMVNESWYSPELKMLILVKRNDPRFGESTYRVTNISRSEPDAQLFQVPSEYTIREGGIRARTPLTDEERRQIELKVQSESRKPNNQ